MKLTLNMAMKERMKYLVKWFTDRTTKGREEP